MPVLFQAAELEEYASHSGGSNSTAGTAFTAANARCAVAIGGGGEFGVYLRSQPFSSSEFWVGHKLIMDNLIWGAYKHTTLMAGGTRRIAIQQSAAGSEMISAHKWNGSSWDLLATSGPGAIVAGQLARYDMYVKLGNPGAFRLYKNNIPIIAITPDFSFGGLANLDTLEFLTGSGNATTYYSEVIVATWNTLGSKLVTRVPDANGAHTEWTNDDFSIVDEPVAGTDYATSGTADQRVSYSFTDFPALVAGETIENLKLTTLALRDASGPQGINQFVRIGTTDYHETDQVLAVAPSGKTNTLVISPATSNPWTVAELNAAQFGVRSRT